MEQTINALILGAVVALSCIFWGWIAVKAWRNGFRPFIFVLAVVGWQRLKFYAAWLRFSRRKEPPQSN